MAVPKQIIQAKGLWRGKSLLNLPWLPKDKQVSESESSLHVDTDEKKTFATITYIWHYEGKREEGTILICMTEKLHVVQLGWVDSWHQNTGVLHLVGEEAANGSLKTKGSYAAGKETWGWTIALDVSADQLLLTMENVMPSGEAIWAVKGTYKRDS